MDEDFPEKELCSCGVDMIGIKSEANVTFHEEEQDTDSKAWSLLLELIEDAAAGGEEEFAPGKKLGPDLWKDILTLPASISKLKNVSHLYLYGSSLVRLPPEVGEMDNLKRFTPYTSYRLHWFPYEITRCKKLKGSTVSTRAIYGNYKHRSPFPELWDGIILGRDKLSSSTISCSVCGQVLGAAGFQRWTSLIVGTDIIPLLANLCSKGCEEAIPDAPENNISRPHAGGSKIKQPMSEWEEIFGDEE